MAGKLIVNDIPAILPIKISTEFNIYNLVISYTYNGGFKLEYKPVYENRKVEDWTYEVESKSEKEEEIAKILFQVLEELLRIGAVEIGPKGILLGNKNIVKAYRVFEKVQGGV